MRILASLHKTAGVATDSCFLSETLAPLLLNRNRRQATLELQKAKLFRKFTLNARLCQPLVCTAFLELFSPLSVVPVLLTVDFCSVNTAPEGLINEGEGEFEGTLQRFESVAHTVKAQDALPDQKHLPSSKMGMVVEKNPQPCKASQLQKCHLILLTLAIKTQVSLAAPPLNPNRSEERRVGKECYD